MARKIRWLLDEGQDLTLFLYDYNNVGTPDEAGYAFPEVAPRAYDYTVADDTLVGTFYAVAKEGANAIASGYVYLGTSADTYHVVASPPETAAAAETSDVSYSAYGPKRVKTKEMEIEQFSPKEIALATERAAQALPCFAVGTVCVGRNLGDVYPRRRIVE